MPYATQANMVERFGETEMIQLTDRSNANAIDAAVLATKLADANSEIDGYLRGRYTLPLASIPLSLVRVACDIARYHLMDDRPTESVTIRYKDAIALLKSISTGVVQLGLDAANAITPVTGLPEVCAPDRVFTADTLKDY